MIAFWSLIALLGSASVYFGVGAEVRRAEFQQADISLQSGDIVSLVKVVDGDTLIVSTSSNAHTSVRLLGIKSFDALRDKDATSTYGQAAADALKRLLEQKPIRVMLHSTPKDKYGRTLATLLVEERDVGMELVAQGLAMVYTVYPFPAMHLYLMEQNTARADRKGIWGNPDAAARADALATEWRKQAP